MKKALSLCLALCACNLIPSGMQDSGSNVAPTPPAVSIDGTKTCSDGGTPSDAGASFDAGMVDAKTQGCINDYVTCATSQCSSKYAECLGPDYKNGNFAGACQTFMTCAKNAKCDGCGTCTACPTIDSTCQTCLSDKIGSCVVNACVSPFLTCMGFSIPNVGSGDSCSKLEACCNSMTGSDKTDCLKTYNTVKIGGAFGCGVPLGTYQSAKKCI